MSADACAISAGFVGSIQPVVLVGGKSARFGRDKLREPLGAEGLWLVQRPILSLRAVFGPRVRIVGDCHSDIVAFADGVLPDQFPGVGPIGGILSALVACQGPVMVLAGDMPDFSAHEVGCVIAAAEAHPEADAVLAAHGGLHPCAGLYRLTAAPALRRAVESQMYRLLDTLCRLRVVECPVAEAATRNVNRPADLVPDAGGTSNERPFDLNGT